MEPVYCDKCSTEKQPEYGTLDLKCFNCHPPTRVWDSTNTFDTMPPDLHPNVSCHFDDGLPYTKVVQ